MTTHRVVGKFPLAKRPDTDHALCTTPAPDGHERHRIVLFSGSRFQMKGSNYVAAESLFQSKLVVFKLNNLGQTLALVPK